MNLTLWKPFTDLERFFDEDFSRMRSDSFFSPNVHVEEDEKYLNVQVELPGLDEKDIKVNVDKNILNISGERKSEKKEDRKGYYYSEISFGKFERNIKLPDYVNADSTKAEYKRGVLQIRLEKKPESQPKFIEVKSSE